MSTNKEQEKKDIAKGKQNIKKFQKQQKELEKNGTWVKVEDEFKPYWKLIKNK
jgi:hypothetical protein